VYSGPIKEAIHSLKYDRNIGAGLALANHLMGMYDQSGWHVDMIIPVPISHERFRERGYNQTSLLAYPLALYARIPYKPKALHRLKNTPTQTGLSARERQKNLLGAFIANPLMVSKANILVVDDVATTGSTLEACSQALVNAGARDVYCFTLAKTLLTNPQLGSVYQQTVIPT
jgi:ComF family protein